MKSKFKTKGDDLYINGNKVIKAYESINGWYWFATEEACTQNSWIDGEVVNDDTIYYGLVQGHEDEWGNFSKAELEALIASFRVWEINPCDLAYAGRRD